MSSQLKLSSVDNIGTPSNSFEILSPDHKELIPRRFFEYSPFNKTEIAKEAGINRKTLYRERVKLSTLKTLKKGILQVVIGTDLTLELFEGKKEDAINWFKAPNTFLFGESPFEVCIRGEGEFLLTWLKDRLGKDEAIEKENSKKIA